MSTEKKTEAKNTSGTGIEGPWWTPENRAKLREMYKGKKISKAGEWLLTDKEDLPEYFVINDMKAVLRQD